MISNSSNHLLNQMAALESMARGQTFNLEQKTEDSKSFAKMIRQAITQVNETQMQAASLAKAFEMGDSQIDLSQVMIAVQKSRVSFQALTVVRNTILSAYQDVMNMPV